GTFSDGTTQDISNDVLWASSNTAVATIGAQTGVALGQGAGTTQVTATLSGVTSTAAPLTGSNATLQSISLFPASASIARNGTLQFAALGTFSDGSQQDVTSSATWASTNNNTATVGIGSGLVRGINSGSAQVSATVNGVTSGAANVTVTAATLKSIAVTPVSLQVATGTSLQYSAAGTYSDGTIQDVTRSVAWSSSRTAVATISASSGLATGIASGTSSITASQGGAGSPAAIATGSLNSTVDSIPD